MSKERSNINGVGTGEKTGLGNLIMTGMVEGSRGRGRPRMKYMDGLVKLVQGEITRAAQFIRVTYTRQRRVEVLGCRRPGGYGTSVS